MTGGSLFWEALGVCGGSRGIQFGKYFFDFYFFKTGSQSLCNLDWPGTHHVAQGGLKLTGIILMQSPECWY